MVTPGSRKPPAAYQTEDGVIALDRNCVNGQEAVTRIEVSHFLDSIRYNRLGAIVACPGDAE